MKILYLSPQLPYPPKSGGTFKSFMLLQHMSKNHEVGFVTLLKGDDADHLKKFKEVIELKYCNAISLDVPRSMANLVKSYFYNIPLTIYRNQSKEMEKVIQHIADEYDLIFSDHYLMYQYIPESYCGSKILHEHNAEYIMWERLAKVQNNWIKRLVINFESKRIRRYEKYICMDATHVISTGSNDIDNLINLGVPNAKQTLVMVVGEDELLEKNNIEFSDTSNTILYIGNLAWEANVDGLIWFIKNVWPVLKVKNPGLLFYLVGKSPSSQLQKLIDKNQGIVLTGFIEDLEEYYSKCRVFIAPLRFGSGVKVKVMNALYRGIPTVTTEIGAEGIKIDDMNHACIANTPTEFADKVGILLKDKAVWERLRDNSRALVKAEYTWDTVLKNLDGVLNG